MRLWSRKILAEIHLQVAVHRDQVRAIARWATPGAVPQFANPDQVLSPPMPWPAPSSPIVPVPFRRIRIFLFPRVCVRLRHGMCHNRVLVALIRTISPKRSRAQWDLRWCCWLVSRQGRRVLILRVTSRLILSLLLRRLARLRFPVCL